MCWNDCSVFGRPYHKFPLKAFSGEESEICAFGGDRSIDVLYNLVSTI